MTKVNPQALLVEHAAGDPLRTIGKRHGVSHELVRRVLLEHGESLLRDLGAALGEGLWPVILVPWQRESDWTDAMAMLFWSIKQLRQRGFDLTIETTQSRGGTYFTLQAPPGRNTSDRCPEA